jgi:hypothetical protein
MGCTSRIPPATKICSTSACRHFDADDPGLDARDQRRMSRIDAEFAGLTGKSHNSALPVKIDSSAPTTSTRIVAAMMSPQSSAQAANLPGFSSLRIFSIFSRASSIVPTM